MVFPIREPEEQKENRSSCGVKSVERGEKWKTIAHKQLQRDGNQTERSQLCIAHGQQMKGKHGDVDNQPLHNSRPLFLIIPLQVYAN